MLATQLKSSDMITVLQNGSILRAQVLLIMLIIQSLETVEISMLPMVASTILSSDGRASPGMEMNIGIIMQAIPPQDGLIHS